MKVARQDILSGRAMSLADAICFTSNGVLRKNGNGIMGAGIAKNFRERFSDFDLEARLGEHLKLNGNCTGILVQTGDAFGELAHVGPSIVCLPTKTHWQLPSDPMLIWASLQKLVQLANKHNWQKVLLTKPGCGRGGLNWRSVEPICKEVLDGRFTICYL